jgi:hypothetical protein
MYFGSHAARAAHGCGLANTRAQPWPLERLLGTPSPLGAKQARSRAQSLPEPWDWPSGHAPALPGAGPRVVSHAGRRRFSSPREPCAASRPRLSRPAEHSSARASPRRAGSCLHSRCRETSAARPRPSRSCSHRPASSSCRRATGTRRTIRCQPHMLSAGQRHSSTNLRPMGMRARSTGFSGRSGTAGNTSSRYLLSNLQPARRGRARAFWRPSWAAVWQRASGGEHGLPLDRRRIRPLSVGKPPDGARGSLW